MFSVVIITTLCQCSIIAKFRPLFQKLVNVTRSITKGDHAPQYFFTTYVCYPLRALKSRYCVLCNSKIKLCLHY